MHKNKKLSVKWCSIAGGLLGALGAAFIVYQLEQPLLITATYIVFMPLFSALQFALAAALTNWFFRALRKR